ITVTKAALEALRKAFRPGFRYKRAGILITELSDDRQIQQSLFETADVRQRHQRLMQAIDSINASSIATDTVHIAAYMPLDSCVRCEHTSPQYSTRISDIIEIKDYKYGS
ncbi:MAG: DUF4113 domain-containing protein, partial [Muribaculaceae bacterium]|nr:DUF4113 domain-containing protein [Muribaculaceae bacterium]